MEACRHTLIIVWYSNAMNYKSIYGSWDTSDVVYEMCHLLTTSPYIHGSDRDKWRNCNMLCDQDCLLCSWKVFFSFIYGAGAEPSPHCYCGHLLASCTNAGWQMVMIVEQLVEWVAGETEVPGGNLPQCSYVHHTSHRAWIMLKPKPPRLEAGDSLLRYGSAFLEKIDSYWCAFGS
jgi:hypothetical protein